MALNLVICGDLLHTQQRTSGAYWGSVGPAHIRQVRILAAHAFRIFILAHTIL